MKDMIYREDAIKAMRDTLVAAEIPYAVNALFKIPSADRPQGEWITDENGGCRCSVCGVREERFIYGLGEYWHGRGESNYCPNCGARMKGAKK